MEFIHWNKLKFIFCASFIFINIIIINKYFFSSEFISHLIFDIRNHYVGTSTAFTAEDHMTFKFQGHDRDLFKWRFDFRFH